MLLLFVSETGLSSFSSYVIFTHLFLFFSLPLCLLAFLLFSSFMPGIRKTVGEILARALPFSRHFKAEISGKKIGIF